MSSVETNVSGGTWARLADRFSGLVPGLSLRKRILLILVLAAIPGIAIAFMLAATSLTDQTQRIETSMQRLARIGAAQHDLVIERAGAILETIALQGAAITSDRALCAAALGKIPDKGQFTKLTVFNGDGNAVCAGDSVPLSRSVPSEAWFADARESETPILGDYIVSKDGEASVVMAVPLIGDDRQFAGAAALGINLKWLDFVASTVKLPDSVTLSAFDSNGVLLSNNTPVGESGSDASAPPAEYARKHMSGLDEGTLRADDTSGSPRVYGFKRTQTAGVVIAAGSPPYSDYVTYSTALLHTVAAPLTLLALTLFAAAFAAEMFVTRHVRSMTRTADEIKAGDYSERTEVPYDEHEIGELAQAFDEMADTVETDHEALTERSARGKMMIDELNHRVKNNFQTMLSMIQMGDNDFTAQDAQSRLKGLSHRLIALAEIHRLLYEKQISAERPRLGPYVQELCDLLNEVYDGKIRLRLRVHPRVAEHQMPVNEFISLGLILNELIANAHKHAFNDGEQGRIRVNLTAAKMHRETVRTLRLTVADNGCGLPENYEIGKKRASSGLHLVRALARQLKGRVKLRHLKAGGAAFDVTFSA